MGEGETQGEVCVVCVACVEVWRGGVWRCVEGMSMGMGGSATGRVVCRCDGVAARAGDRAGQ